jgi:hypothetical protein
MLEPEVTYFHRTDITPKVFDYWHGNDDDWTWDGKVIHLEDPTVELLNSSSVKTRASGIKWVTKVIEQKAVDIVSEGQPNLVLTTFEGVTGLELVRRFPFISMDTSEALTKKVIEGMSREVAGEDRVAKDFTLTKALKKLKTHNVLIPYAKELSEHMPNKLLMRTYYPRLLDYIKSSCVLHQYQRLKDQEGRLIATWDDYDIGRLAFLKTVTNEQMISLNPDEKKMLYLLTMNGEMFVSDISQEIPRPKSWIYDRLNYLMSFNLVEKTMRYKDDANREITSFSAVGRLYEGCLIPPTDKSFGFRGCLEITRERVDGSNVFHYSNNTTNTIQPSYRDTRKTLLKPPYDQLYVGVSDEALLGAVPNGTGPKQIDIYVEGREAT